VFTAPQSGPLREQKFVAGVFKPAAARVGLPIGGRDALIRWAVMLEEVLP
jgi:hypothetical protein